MKLIKEDLWKECVCCKSHFCCLDKKFSPFFVTDEEISKIKERGFDIDNFNKKSICNFFSSDGKCKIQDYKPVDCQLFPFDVHKDNGKFYWMIWKIPCPIVSKTDKEKYLKFFEENIIPKFRKYLEEYASFRDKELRDNFQFEILREINL